MLSVKFTPGLKTQVSSTTTTSTNFKSSHFGKVSSPFQSIKNDWTLPPTFDVNTALFSSTEQKKEKLSPESLYQQGSGLRASLKACVVSKEFRDKVGFRKTIKLALHKMSANFDSSDSSSCFSDEEENDYESDTSIDLFADDDLEFERYCFVPQTLFSERSYPQKFCNFPQQEEAPVNHLLKSRDERHVSLVLKSSKYEAVERYWTPDLFPFHNQEKAPLKSILKVKKNEYYHEAKARIAMQARTTTYGLELSVALKAEEGKKNRSRDQWLRKTKIRKTNKADKAYEKSRKKSIPAIDPEKKRLLDQERARKLSIAEGQMIKSVRMDDRSFEAARRYEEIQTQRRAESQAYLQQFQDEEYIDGFYEQSQYLDRVDVEEQLWEEEMAAKESSKRRRIINKFRRVKDSFLRHTLSPERYFEHQEAMLVY